MDAHKYIFYSDFQQTTTRPQISCFSQGFLCGSLYFVHEFSVQVSNQDNWSLRVWVRLFIQSLGFYFCNKVCVYLTQPFVGVIVILCLHLLDRSVQPEIYWYLQVLLFSGYIFFILPSFSPEIPYEWHPLLYVLKSIFLPQRIDSTPCYLTVVGWQAS